MSHHLQTYVQSSLPPSTTPLIIMSDIDEIPSRHTISLLAACDFGQRIHLRMRNYLYSFEWLLGLDSSWRASANAYPASETGEREAIIYRHSKTSDIALSSAGWHCSFCFRTLSEYAEKMLGYSHSDRIGGDLSLLEEEHIQDAVCRGEDVFGMLPEAYNVSSPFLNLKGICEPLNTPL